MHQKTEIKIPPNDAALERDARGYVIPWNVLRAKDATAFFTVNDDRKQRLALDEDLCPLCGEMLGRWKWFIGGPRSAFDAHGWYTDLPGHHDCVQYALRVCPYLAAPNYSRRVDVIHPEKLPNEARILLDSTMLPERPDLFVAVASPYIEVRENFPFVPYVRPTQPRIGYEYWKHGEQITEREALPFVRRALNQPGWNCPVV